ncbi:GTP-binding protein [Galdieria sulphuraria]|uniref:GTP-binding protein n=1 Tax=Galdieria sulphuraria TaxID=130081 RepID=M2XYT2_GALSU|nr:GTP-binding protein [Galdieria sulphuraria]EME28669.1 GTP-binding protein [Galdieria sulphuraria]|eukprot:XP_005705189.1 GTP-binding protein [Galdieria sulphuraria]
MKPALLQTVLFYRRCIQPLIWNITKSPCSFNPKRCLSSRFVDRVRVVVSGGNGGPGLSSFTRDRDHECGAPDGGSGGRGGNVYVECRMDCKSLPSSQKRFRGELGGSGGRFCTDGARGEDCVIPVPCGTLVKAIFQQEENVLLEEDKDDDSLYFTRSGIAVLGDLNQDGERILVAAGGKGGRGNHSFHHSRKKPIDFFEEGFAGQTRLLELELKSIADVGLVGFPNAGKSSLLRAISRAKPKVAPYPFTTLRPYLGVVQGNNDTFTCADIPGLVEGAYQNRGLGHDFLRHIERTSILLYVIDISGYEDLDVASTFHILRRELEMYNSSLVQRPFVIVLNKMDLIQDNRKLLEICENFVQLMSDDIPIFPVSAEEKLGLSDLVLYLHEMVVRVGKRSRLSSSELEFERLLEEEVMQEEREP